MRIEYREYMEQLQFPKEAIEALCPQADEYLESLAGRYMGGEMDFAEALKEAGEDEGRRMMLVFACLPEVRRRYGEQGIPEKLFWDSMMDLKYKLEECRKVKGKWGTFVADWYEGFLAVKRFALGRLQFEKARFTGDEPFRCGGFTVEPGAPAINIHIPSAGPLREEMCLDAYRQAYEFFPEQRIGDKMVFVCHSWLLDPEYNTFLPENSNILRFQRDFTILECERDEAFGDGWRVFGADAGKAPQELPRNTSVQRGFADFLAAGGKTGCGYGVFVWDRNGRVIV